jgi:hypothetical protein
MVLQLAIFLYCLIPLNFIPCCSSSKPAQGGGRLDAPRFSIWGWGQIWPWKLN